MSFIVSICENVGKGDDRALNVHCLCDPDREPATTTAIEWPVVSPLVYLQEQKKSILTGSLRDRVSGSVVDALVLLVAIVAMNQALYDIAWGKIVALTSFLTGKRHILQMVSCSSPKKARKWSITLIDLVNACYLSVLNHGLFCLSNMRHYRDDVTSWLAKIARQVEVQMGLQMVDSPNPVSLQNLPRKSDGGCHQHNRRGCSKVFITLQKNPGSTSLNACTCLYVLAQSVKKINLHSTIVL